MKDEQFEKFKKDYFQFTVSIRVNAFRSLNKKATQGGIVFVGDSITEGYPIHEMLTSNVPLYNRGVAGDNALGVFEKLQDVVFDLLPSKIFLLIGTNDLGQGANVSEVLDRITAICYKIKDILPNTQLYVLSIYPENKAENYRNPLAGDSTRTNVSIQIVNHALAELCQKEGLHFINVYSKLLDREGNLAKAYTYDGLHLTVEGYHVVSEILQAYLN